MKKNELTYTTVILDKNGRVANYVLPNFPTPVLALAHLKQVRRENPEIPYERIAVVRTAVDLLDAEELVELIDNEQEKL